jgi:hypothetical protein
MVVAGRKDALFWPALGDLNTSDGTAWACTRRVPEPVAVLSLGLRACLGTFPKMRSDWLFTMDGSSRGEPDGA